MFFFLVIHPQELGLFFSFSINTKTCICGVTITPNECDSNKMIQIKPILCIFHPKTSSPRFLGWLKILINVLWPSPIDLCFEITIIPKLTFNWRLRSQIMICVLRLPPPYINLHFTTITLSAILVPWSLWFLKVCWDLQNSFKEYWALSLIEFFVKPNSWKMFSELQTNS